MAKPRKAKAPAASAAPSQEELKAKQVRVLQLKNMLIQNSVGKYHTFMNELSSLPVSPEDLSKVKLFMDTGILWLKEAVMKATITLGANPVAPPQGKQQPKAKAPSKKVVKKQVAKKGKGKV